MLTQRLQSPIHHTHTRLAHRAETFAFRLLSYDWLQHAYADGTISVGEERPTSWVPPAGGLRIAALPDAMYAAFPGVRQKRNYLSF